MSTNGNSAATAQLQALLHDPDTTPAQIAETVVHTLYAKLSTGATNTYARLGRGVVLMDLRALDAGKLDTSYVPEALLHRLNIEFALFDEAERAVATYDPLSEFVVIVWQSAFIMIYRLQQV